MELSNLLLSNNTSATNKKPTAFTGYPSDNWGISAYTTTANGLASATSVVAVNASTGQVLTAINSTTASWQSQNVKAQLQKCTDVISTNLINNTYTQPSLNVIIVLYTTGIYKINALQSGCYSLIYNGSPYPTNYFINILYVNGTLYALANNMTTYTSTNYTTWNQITNNTATFFTAITPSGNTWGSTSYIINDGIYFCMSGYNSSSPNANMYHIIRSTDCMTWSPIGVSDAYYFAFGFYYILQLSVKYYSLRNGPSGDFQVYLDQSSDGVTFTKVDLSSYFTARRPPESISYQNGIIFVSEGYYTNLYTIYSTNLGST